MIRIKSGFSGERSLVLPKMVTSMMSADAIASVLYITDIGYYPNADAHFRERKKKKMANSDSKVQVQVSYWKQLMFYKKKIEKK